MTMPGVAVLFWFVSFVLNSIGVGVYLREGKYCLFLICTVGTLISTLFLSAAIMLFLGELDNAGDPE